MIFDKSIYDHEFYEWHDRHVHEMMYAAGLKFVTHYKPESLVDFGCGIGSYLLAAHDLKVKVKGYEIGGNDAKIFTNVRVREFVEFDTDITKPIGVFRNDMSFCIEVAEHIEPTGSQQLINNIVGATKRLCVFSAAPKSQDGTGHINTHSKGYWIHLFEQGGMKYNEKQTKVLKELWNDGPDYVLKNLMVFK